MAKKTKSPFPTREQILKYIQETPGRIGKRELARAFQLDAGQKILLKKELKSMAEDGLIERAHGKRYGQPGTLPSVSVLEVSGTDIDGEILAKPIEWKFDEPPPLIYMAPMRAGQRALANGERVLAKLERLADMHEGRAVYEARTIRRIAHAPTETLGVYREGPAGQGRVRSTNRRHKSEFFVADDGGIELFDGDLVLTEALKGKHLGLPRVKIQKKLSATGEKSISLIAIYEHDIPNRFPESVVDEAERAKAAPLGKREDLRDLALITIDGADARDFDDAVFAEPDPENKGGWHLIVAIADVSWYVRPESPLDVEAYKRGNSVYFPDRVVPMLPEALSNGWCSLVEGEDRPCIAAHMWIDAGGNLTHHRFVRALMRSSARTTYEQIQEAHDGRPNKLTRPLMDDVIAPLYGAYETLLKAREARGVLELDLPEKKIDVDVDGKVTGVSVRPRFDSHKLIEEFMVLANVAAAETLEKMKLPCMYRIHGEPSREKLVSLKDFLDSISIPFSLGQVIRPNHFNIILQRAADTPNSHLVNQVVLRSQSQAEYSPDNIGHFGLALKRYCHFTSPIRRYSDLLVHRALVKGLGAGEGALEDDHKDFAEMGEHISDTERRAAGAERDAVDRFAALYLSERIGALFNGRISGVTRFGLFVELNETGADGLVPIRTLNDDYYEHDEARHMLVGKRHGRTYRLGEGVEVMLMEADPITGGTTFEIMNEGENKKSPKLPKPSGKKPFKGKPSNKNQGKKPKGKSRASRRRAKNAK